MHDILKVIILSFVEGITEFLPISSTGHLILVNHWIKFNGSFANAFDVIIQFGAILSVVVLYWKKLFPFTAELKLKKNSINLWMKVITAFIPAVFFGLLLGGYIEKKLFNPITVAIALFVGGIIIVILDNRTKKINITSLDEISYKTAFAIGCIQCLALIPGTSRSAATIIGAILLGASREVAAEFSFFLAVPTMAAATTYSLLKSGINFTTGQWFLLALGVVLSFIVAYAVIVFFMNYIRKRNFKIFGYYRIILGAIILLFFFLK